MDSLLWKSVWWGRKTRPTYYLKVLSMLLLAAYRTGCLAMQSLGVKATLSSAGTTGPFLIYHLKSKWIVIICLKLRLNYICRSSVLFCRFSLAFYQLIFANTASTIVSGAVAERLNLPCCFSSTVFTSQVLIFLFLYSCLLKFFSSV